MDISNFEINASSITFVDHFNISNFESGTISAAEVIEINLVDVQNGNYFAILYNLFSPTNLFQTKNTENVMVTSSLPSETQTITIDSSEVFFSNVNYDESIIIRSTSSNITIENGFIKNQMKLNDSQLKGTPNINLLIIQTLSILYPYVYNDPSLSYMSINQLKLEEDVEIIFFINISVYSPNNNNSFIYLNEIETNDNNSIFVLLRNSDPVSVFADQFIAESYDIILSNDILYDKNIYYRTGNVSDVKINENSCDVFQFLKQTHYFFFSYDDSDYNINIPIRFNNSLQIHDFSKIQVENDSCSVNCTSPMESCTCCVDISENDHLDDISTFPSSCYQILYYQNDQPISNEFSIESENATTCFSTLNNSTESFDFSYFYATLGDINAADNSIIKISNEGFIHYSFQFSASSTPSPSVSISPLLSSSSTPTPFSTSTPSMSVSTSLSPSSTPSSTTTRTQSSTRTIFNDQEFVSQSPNINPNQSPSITSSITPSISQSNPLTKSTTPSLSESIKQSLILVSNDDDDFNDNNDNNNNPQRTTSSSKSSSQSFSSSSSPIPIPSGIICSADSCSMGNTQISLVSNGNNNNNNNNDQVIDISTPDGNLIGQIFIPAQLINNGGRVSVSYFIGDSSSERVSSPVFDIELYDAVGNSITILDYPITICLTEDSSSKKKVCIFLIILLSKSILTFKKSDCLGYYNVNKGRWVCEDNCLDKENDDVYCGETGLFFCCFFFFFWNNSKFFFKII